MNAKPILFSAPMIRALLEGRKIQTRRIVKPSIVEYIESDYPEKGYISSGKGYGKSGDYLWVKETFHITHDAQRWKNGTILYRADVGIDIGGSYVDTCKWKPSIFMPRWASRITLKIKKVRVERLQDIIEQDAQAEGCGATVDYAVGRTYRTEFQELWRSIHGRESWQQNPWLWVIEFEVIKQNIDAVLKVAA